MFLVYCLVGGGLSIAVGCHLPKSVNGGGLGHAIFTGCVLYMGLNVESGQCQGYLVCNPKIKCIIRN